MYRFPQANIDAFIREGHVTVDDILPRDVIDRAADSFDALYANDVKPTGIIEQPVGIASRTISGAIINFAAWDGRFAGFGCTNFGKT